MKPTVCFVLPGPAMRTGGGHKVVYQYANHLSRMGACVWILHMRPGKAKDRGHGRARAVMLRIAYFVGRYWRPRWYPLRRDVRVRNYFRQDSVRVPYPTTVLVATSVRTAEFVSRVAIERGIRGLYLIQHFESYSAPVDFVESTWRLPLERVVVSGWLNSVADRLGVDAHLIRNGVDPEEFPAGPPVTDRTPSVLALVSSEPWKRSDLVAEMMSLIHERLPDVRLRTFGVCERPAILPSYVEHARDPDRQLLSRLYREASLYVCASDSEGFGLPVAEAMASGAAVVSTDNGGVPDFAGDRLDYVPVGDAKALADRVVELLSDPPRLTEVAHEGHQVTAGMSLLDAATRFAELCMGAKDE